MVVIDEVISHPSAFRISKIVGTEKDVNGQISAVRVVLLSSKDFDKHEIVLPMNAFKKLEDGGNALETFIRTTKGAKEGNEEGNKKRGRKKRNVQQDEENSNKEPEEANAHEGILRMLNLKSVTLNVVDKPEKRRGRSKKPVEDDKGDNKGKVVAEGIG